MTHEQKIKALIDAVEKIDSGSPPSDWEYYVGMGDYAGYKEFDRGAPDHVDCPDTSNGGDLHSHGWSCGYWQAAKELRAANARDSIKLLAEIAAQLEAAAFHLHDAARDIRLGRGEVALHARARLAEEMAHHLDALLAKYKEAQDDK